MKNFKISTKLLILGLSIGIISTLIVGGISTIKTSKALHDASHDKLEALSGLKKKSIEDFYVKMIASVESLSETMDVEMLYADLKKYHDEMHTGATDNFPSRTEEYKNISNNYAKHIGNIVESNQYYDLFVICAAHGHVMYTYAEESDLGANLKVGELKNSHLAEAWRGAIDKGTTYITDLEKYAPSNGAPAQFIASPLKNDEDKIIAVVAIQVPDPLINEIMTDRLGLGETGESYLVGRDHIMRSNSRFQKDAILKTEVNSETLLKGLEGKSGIETVKDYRGVSVISAYNKLDVEGLDWAILTEIDESEAHAASTVLKDAIRRAIIIMIIVIGIITWYFSKSMSRPIERAASFAEVIANGDLTQTIEINQDDEIGKMTKALSGMASKLREIIASVITGSDNIAAASQQISSTAQQMSQGATEQASSVEEVSSTMEEMSSNIQQNTDNALETERISEDANAGIKDVAEQSNKAVEANKAISEKIEIVNDIALQTNILALNAAVEAARAGEQGRGFAVVAAEVRKLAEKSKHAAEEIVALAVRSLKLAQGAGDVMGQTLPKIDNTTKLVQEIAAASMEQNNGSNQINNGIQQLNSVAQQNAAVSEELATSAEEMSGQAEQLKSIISFFKVDKGTGHQSYALGQNNLKAEVKQKVVSEHQQMVEFTANTDEEGEYL